MTTSKKKTRIRRKFTTQEKLKAVLMVWTQSRSATEVCREMKLSWTLLDRWQNQAMEGMLNALEPKKKEKPAPLNDRLERLLEKKLSARSGGFVKLEDRLETVQKKRQAAPN